MPRVFITDNKSIVSTSSLIFTFSTTTLPLLKELGFSLFSQANNHALNFGWLGLEQSKANIAAAGMDSLATQTTLIRAVYHPAAWANRGVCRVRPIFNHSMATTPRHLPAIAQAKAEGAFVIVYPHWGIEYQATTTPFQEVEAHKFIDAGADAVFGGHPHVIEPIEITKTNLFFTRWAILF